MTHIYDLNERNNYNYELTQSSNEIFIVYVNIINSFLNKYINTTSILTNTTEFYYLLKKGIETITHIFKMMLINTKNIIMVEYYCTNGIIYYIEFIKLNNESDTNRINYNNASLFTYEKSIYKIKTHYKKTAHLMIDDEIFEMLLSIETREIEIYNNIDRLVYLYRFIINLYVEQYHSISKKEINLYDYIDANIRIYIECLLNFAKEEQSLRLSFIVDFISVNKQCTLNTLFILLEQIKKNPATIMNKANLINKLQSCENKQAYTDFNYITWLLS
jgi:hypothetical protein